MLQICLFLNNIYSFPNCIDPVSLATGLMLPQTVAVPLNIDLIFTRGWREAQETPETWAGCAITQWETLPWNVQQFITRSISENAYLICRIRWSNVSSMWFHVWNHTLTDLCFLYMENGIGISVNTLIIHCDTLAT